MGGNLVGIILHMVHTLLQQHKEENAVKLIRVLVMNARMVIGGGANFVLMGLCRMTALTGSAAVLSVRKRETLIALRGSADPLVNIVLKMMSNAMIGKESVVNHA